MDPNETLRLIRAALKRLDHLSGKGPDWAIERRLETDILRDGVEAMDAWLSGGGFLPAEWERTEPLAPRPGNATDPAWHDVAWQRS